MGLLVYKFSDYSTTHEREHYRALCNSLRDYYNSSKEWCIFLANYNIYDTELDGLIIKQDAIIGVELKKHGGEIHAEENGQWTAGDGSIIKGGSGKSVYQQAKVNHISIRKGMKAATRLSSKQLSDISALIVFQKPITKLYNNLGPATQCWLHITDTAHFIEKVQDITTDKLYLEPTDMLRLIDELALNEDYLDEQYSNPEMLTMTFDDEPEDETAEAPTEGPIVEINKYPRPNDSDSAPTADSEQTGTAEPLPIVPEHPSSGQQSGSSEQNWDIEAAALSLQQLLERLGIDKPFELYGPLAENRPTWIKQEIPPQEPIAVSFLNGEEALLFEQSTGIKLFWHKSFCYWRMLQDVGMQPLPAPESSPLQQPDIAKSKSSLTLPQWLDELIYGKLGAKYAPDHVRFENNLDLSEDDIKTYLGTYFPRSFAEAYAITRELLNDQTLSEIYSKKEELQFFDFACGTGGDIVGFLSAIAEALPAVKRVTIFAIDGNRLSLKYLKKIVKRFMEITPELEIKLHAAAIPLENIVDASLLCEILTQKFDFIFANKCVCELIDNKVLQKDAYEYLLNSFAPKLSDDGLMMLLDVTTKSKRYNEFFPVILNRGVGQFVKSNPDFRTLLPLSCGLFENKCTAPCFTQRHFKVSHREKQNDLSKVTYRLVGKAALVARISHPKKSASYVTTPDSLNKSTCVYSTGEPIINSFQLKY